MPLAIFPKVRQLTVLDTLDLSPVDSASPSPFKRSQNVGGRLGGGVLLFLLLFLAACDTQTPQQPVSNIPLNPVSVHNLQIVTGQTIYVPAYSEIFYGTADRTMRLAVTLAIHNTDPEKPIIIEAVEYYDTNGQLVRNYITEAVEVPPLATTGFVVEDRDQSGGWGANFIVKWVAEEAVYEPVVEAIMVSTGGTQGISMISPGRIVSQIEGD